jgi:inorganic pyrophosphatase
VGLTEDIPTYVDEEEDESLIHVVIETPRDQRHKYAFDPKSGLFRRKQILVEGLMWPYDYGFIPQTLGDDGDAVDALFLCDEATFTGCLVEARVLGIIEIRKNGDENDRIVTAPKPQKGVSQTTDWFDDLEDVPKATIKSVCRYLIEYSAEEGNEMEFRGAHGRKKALHAIERGRQKFATKAK